MTTIRASDYRDPKALPELLRRVAARLEDDSPFHRFGGTAEAKNIIRHAADELDQMGADRETILNVVAKIAHSNAQNGADALAMRSIAMDFMSAHRTRNRT